MDISFSEVDSWLEDSYPQMERDLLQLLAYPTLRGAAEPGAPFGRPLAEALEYCLHMAEGFGLTTENVDGYLGFADLAGAEQETVGVLSHVDVVPANPADWQQDPFAPELREGRIYARGASDDKGPLVASLYAGMALAHTGIPLKKTVRFMFGCDEESGMSCVRYYLQKHNPPCCGFSPDGSFPLVMGEKGLGRFSLTGSWQADQGVAPLKLLSVQSGTVLNVVPDRAEAIFLIEGPVEFAGSQTVGLTLERDGSKLRVTASGKAAHASMPEEGENALAKLLQFLARQQFAPRGAKKYVETLAKLFVDPSFGENLGVADEDALSKLTVAPTILSIGENGGKLSCDMRFTLSRKAGYFQEKLENAARENELNLEDWQGTEPLFAGEDSPLASGLLNAYREVSGDFESKPIVMGGGTYAKMLPNFLAFGPVFPGAPHLAHQANEYIDGKELLDIAKIYARAIYQLAR